MGKEKRIVWTTKKVKEAAKKLDDGYILPGYAIPFFDKTVGLRKAGISFGFTGNELDEYTKCKVDINYFANNYCYVKSEDGSFKVIKLRDYQYDIMDLFNNNKLSILMCSRQIGKCLEFNTSIDIYNKSTGIKENIKFYKLLFKSKRDKNIYDYLKYFIYYSIDVLSS